MLTPPPVRKNRNKMKLRERGAMDGNVLPLDPCRGNRPHRLRWLKLEKGKEMKLTNVIVVKWNRTNLYFKTTFTRLPLEFFVLFFKVRLCAACLGWYRVKVPRRRPRLKMPLTAIPSLPACFRVTSLLIYKKGLPMATTCQVSPPLRGWQLTWANWRC